MALVKYNNNSISTISSAGQLASGSLVPIKTLTASSSSTLSFVHGSSDVVLDSTYPIYLFKFINIHPATDNALLTFQGSTNTGSSYGVTITSTHFRAYNYENAAAEGLNYLSAEDFSQSTAFINVTENETVGNGNDENLTGTFHLYNPSSTTFVKHFTTRFNFHTNSDSFQDQYIVGYVNSTSAVDAVQFKMSSGNIDAGVIKLYGIS